MDPHAEFWLLIERSWTLTRNSVTSLRGEGPLRGILDAHRAELDTHAEFCNLIFRRRTLTRKSGCSFRRVGPSRGVMHSHRVEVDRRAEFWMVSALSWTVPWSFAWCRVFLVPSEAPVPSASEGRDPLFGWWCVR